MGIIFSGDEIIEMAVKTEETGYTFYNLASENTASDKLKDLFDYLAKEELKHKEAYLALTDAIGETTQGVPIDWEEMSLYVKAMTDSSFFLGSEKNINLATKTSDEKEVVDFAIGFEKDTLLFFYHLRDIVKETNRPVVDGIINEEKAHIQKLTEIKQSL